MSFFDQVVGKIFGKQSPKSAMIHEVLSRSEKYLEGYDRWLNSEAPSSMLTDIHRSYYLKKQKITSEVDVHILESVYANGFAISFNERFTQENFTWTLDLIKDRVLEHGYRLSSADRKISDKGNYEETIEKWYLKPISEEFDTNVFNQRFGNITIEKVEIDRKPNYLKFLASIYQDRLYTKALPFDDLMDKVFTTTNS